jgi:hypothetical protein
LLHGDAYFSNFLCPLEETNAPAVLLDWQSPCWDVGALDLVNLCATFWSREQRADRQRELEVLRTYHAALCAAGVRGYTFEDLCLDYRLGLVYWLLVPVQDAHDGSVRDYWRPKMHNLIDAFTDWDCEELLAP